MSWRNFVLRLRALLFRRQMDEELQEELHFHIEMQERKNRRHDLDPAEAKRQARLQFGGVVSATEECREQRGISSIEILVKDVRFALRMLRKSPGFSAVAVATLALGIGANAVVFGVLNALVLRPLNVPQAESLWGLERGSDKAVNQSYPDYLDLRDRNRSFDDLAAYNVAAVGLDTGNNPSAAWIFEVTGNYFDALSIQPYLGRFFHGADEHGPNSAPYIVLTYAFWHSHFQDDRGVAGRTVQLNKHPFTILGVAPPEFRGTLLFVFPDFWVPIVNQEQVEGANVLNARGNRGILMVLGHLKAGVTPAQAVADLNSIGSYLEKTYPKDDGQMTFSLTRPGLTGDWLGGPLRAFLTGLMLLAGLILLAACANLGSLFAARTADRSREVALRLALGSSPMRILRQLFTEAVLLSLIGGAVGLWGSVVLLHGLSVWQPLPTAPLHVPVNPDANVYGVALLLSLASGFLFGVVPVRQVLHTDPYQVIKSGSTGTVGRRMTVRDLLLVMQIAICAVLVTSSLVVVNREFANRIFGSATNAMGGYFKRRDGTRIQVVGIVEDGKYASLAEDPQPAMFLPILQSPSSETSLVVRSNRDPQQLVAAIKSTVRDVDAGLPFTIRTWNQELESALFPSRMATLSLGVLGVMGAMLSITGIFGMAAYSVSKRLRELGIRMALGAQRKEVLQAALGRAFKLLAIGSAIGLFLGILASRVLSLIVYQATPRDPLVLAGVVLAMLLLGLLAAWIPAQRALSVDPSILLREE